jgi:MFS transporter, PAT family, beta-lactamase induction signal transducer AmpG
MTLGNLGRIVGAKLIGPVKDQFDWNYTLLMFAMMIAIVWGLIQFLNINNHVKQVDRLEVKYSAIE